MNKYIKRIAPVAALLLTMSVTSCVGDLDVTPIDPNLQTEINPDHLLNKCYANFGLAGNGGPDGDCDIDGLDGGTTGFVRQLFNSNDLTTDEAICNWTQDEGITEFNFNKYGASHPMLKGFYYRLYFGVTICNQYLTNFGDLDKQKSAEVRFIRALDYYYLMDAFGNIPFTEAVSAQAAPQYSRKQIYDYIEKELLAIEPDLMPAKAKTSADPNYGRVDKAAAWLLLSRLYLNAEVYTGTPQWQKAADYAKKVIDSPYKLYKGETKNGWTAYQQLFMGDNGENGSSVEAIFPILQDGKTTASYGTSVFLINACYDKTASVNKNGKIGGNLYDNANWAGVRARKNLIDKFFPVSAPQVTGAAMPAEAGDDRALFDGVGREVSAPESKDISVFTKGYAVVKFNNFHSDNSSAHDLRFADTDFFLFRAAEAYLTYAEATARLNGNQTTAEGTDYINQLHLRAHAKARTNGAYTLDDILNEWSKEFYFEGRRRVDLIRFNKFGGNVNYNWAWKGGDPNGRNFAKTRNVFAIPTSDLTVNQNLTQNPGY
ncbi:RagB/SusD family nutrient uptake outer membrane protein [Prevotella disiens]|uniref:Membrane protein n=1 Tax=Prevotella disiens DNF00882 TaxID=1401075 RepID=A0A096ASJ7_9BACT|nr:RagB/SusD family nutrient uptake outer membrane protein [Prevotella disiens]KGF49715.1 membrane protein [Prevotella disiens DNF00882]